MGVEGDIFMSVYLKMSWLVASDLVGNVEEYKFLYWKSFSQKII